MKLEKIKYYDIKNTELRNHVLERMNVAGIVNFKEIMEDYKDVKPGNMTTVQAIIAYDPEDKIIFDVKLFDPFHRFSLRGERLYTDSTGWTGWILAWEDPDNGCGMDEIFDAYNGYLFSGYVSPDDGTHFKVYLSDLEEQWVEEYGQENWENADFEEIDCEIQTANPELFFCDHDSDDRGEYLLYTTDESDAR